MRNLKKFLALVLAMMMVFGLMVTANATSVDDFADGDEVSEDYRQAVEVIAALGVLQGDGTSLYPQGKLTRAHMAAVLYRTGTGNTPIQDSKGVSTEDKDVILQFMKNADSYKDVPAGHWATGYINFVTDKGWLTGYTKDYFGPDDTLSVVQMLSGVLRMLGNPPASTGSWEMNTLKAAQELHLIDDFTPAQLAGDATREMVAQIALNAMVYDPDNSKTGTFRIDLTAEGKAAFASTDNTSGTSYTYVESNPGFLALDGKEFATRADAILSAYIVSAQKAEMKTHYDVVEVEKENKSLGAKNFSLSNPSNATDPYGRPITVYKKGDTIISELPKDPVFDQNTPITGAELYNKLGPDAVITRELTSAASSYANTPATRTTIRDGRVDTTPYGGNGVSVEIYKIKDDTYTAVVIAPVFAQVTDIKSVRKTATEGAYTQYVLSGISKDLKIYSSTVSSDDVTNVTVNGTVEEDDYVIVDTIKTFNSKGKVVTSYEITPVRTISGVISRYTSSSDSFTIGGRSYPASAIPGSDSDALMNAVGDGETHLVALDDDGNVVDIVDDTAVIASNYIFALHDQEIIKISGNTGVTAWTVIGIDKNGNLVTLQMNKWITNDAAETGATGLLIDDDKTESAGTDKARGLYTYERNNSSSYNLTYAVNSGTAKVYLSNPYNATKVLRGGYTFTINGESLLATNGSSSVYATSNTKYYVAVQDSDGKYTGVTTYTGVASIKISSTITDSTAIAAIDADGDGIAEVVFIDSYTAAADGYAYVLDEYEKDEEGDYYYTAYINGEWTTLKQGSELTVALPALVHVSGGSVTPLSAADTTSLKVLTMNADTYTYNSGLIIAKPVSGSSTIFATDVGKDVPVYIFNGDEATKTTAEKLKNDGGAVMVFVRDGTADKNILAIYIVEDALGYGTLAGGETMADIKELPDGVYTPADGTFAADMAGTAANNRIFKYTATADEKYTLNVYRSSNNQLVYSEAGSITKDKGDAGVFYIVLSQVNLNSGGTANLKGAWAAAPTAAAASDTYTYEIVGQTSKHVASSGSFVQP